MNTFFTNRKSRRPPYFLIGTLLSIFFTIFCCVYLFTAFSSKNTDSSFFTTKALAKSSLPTAQKLSVGSQKKETLPARETYYYYIHRRKALVFHFESPKLKNLKVSFLSDTGNKLSYNRITSGNTKSKLVPNIPEKGPYLFLKLTNPTTTPLPICFLAEESSSQTIRSKNNTKTNHPNKSRISKNNTKSKNDYNTQNRNSSQNKITSKPKKKSSSYLSPHFVCIKVNESRKLSIKNGSKKIWTKKCRCISSSPNVAQVKGQTLYALSEGTAILYLKSNSSSTCGSSCLVRVLPADSKLSY